ncbi:calcium-binding protein [Francisella uliginis]|uniref:Haemolysin-type calcium binding-related domain-containing protein n=1 Tax=Francisella uliginis TaxID=573570 RepID=A0A1L4BRP1_9GAMM|nr:calcium-binding protein [Francisella uliginis]API86507.1 hypothetical protein F7310_03695 [Francisella uliginis]
MSTDNFNQQLTYNLNQDLNTAQAKRDFMAELSELMYAESLNSNKPKVNAEGQATLYAQFYNDNGEVRKEITGDVRQYLQNQRVAENSRFLDKLRDYNVVALSGDNWDGYAGMVISPKGQNNKGILVSRGSENILTHPNDWGNNFEMGALNIADQLGIEAPESSLQFQTSKQLLIDARKNQPTLNEISTTGHSQGGAIAIALEKVIYLTDGLTLGETYAFNPPGFASSATEGLNKDQIDVLKSKTHIYSVAGDPVSDILFTNQLVDPVTIYTSSNDKHAMANLVTANQSTFNPENNKYLNSNGNLDEAVLADRLTLLDNVIESQEGLLANNSSVENIWLKTLNDTGLADNTNPYKLIEAATLEKQGLQNMLGNLDDYGYVASNYQSIDLANDMMLASVGGHQGESLINAIVNSVNKLPTTEEKAQFVDSLKNSDVFDNVLGSEATDSMGIQSIDELVLSKFQQAATQRYGDPLVVDLDRDGKLETTSANGDVLFDHDNDGQATGTGWVNADDGLLVRDIDGSGTIDSGRELFGDNTIKSDGTKAVDGFDALNDLDSNNNNVFDSSDTAYEEVKVWQDKDQDGVTDEGELTSLADAGIDSIDLNAKTVNQNVEGGILRKTSTATNTDGGTTAVGAMDFAENKFYSKFEDVLETSQELQNSINVAGQGALRSLHEAASLSPDLKELLTGLYSGDTPVTDSAIHEVLLEWARTSQNFETSLDILDGVTLDDGTQINVGISDRVRNVIEQTAILEALNGSRILEYNIRDNGDSYGIYVQTGEEVFDFADGGATVVKGNTVNLNDWDFHRLADNGRTTVINQGYVSALNSIKDLVQTNSVLTEVQPFLLENISFELDDTGEVALNFDGISETIINKIKADPSNGLSFLDKVIQVENYTLLNDNWNSSNVMNGDNFTLEEIAAINSLNYELNGKRVIIGTDDIDELVGTDSAEAIYGGLGDDHIDGGKGDDILYGGLGDDYLSGGLNGSDKLYGGEGNDTISTGRGSHIEVEGGKGDDSIYSSYSSKNVVYKYDLGDGFDVIKRESNSYYGVHIDHKIEFGESISQSDIKFEKSGNNLIVMIKGDSSQGIRVENFYSTNNKYKSLVESFEFADGSVLTRSSGVFNFALEGSDNADVLSGSDQSESLTGDGGDDSLYGQKGNDILDGGIGDDYLNGGSEQDILYGGAGNDNLDGGSESDILYGGEGDDNLYGGFGNDKLYGGSGDDTINTGQGGTSEVEGGQGNDIIISGYGTKGNTYRYNLGDGFDVIKRESNSYYGVHIDHKIEFGESISQSDIKFEKSGNNLIVMIKGDSSQGIRVENFYSTNNKYKSLVESFEFTDGSVLTRSSGVFNFDIEGSDNADVLSGSDQSESLTGNGGDDSLYGRRGNDTLDGGQGSDILYGGEGNDILCDEEGNDALYGERGNDILDGGKGEDHLDGGHGNDVLFGGEGNDTLDGSYGDDRIYGGLGNDIIYTGSWSSDDYVEGGKGNDTIFTSLGTSKSTYKYNLGDGFDVIQRDKISGNYVNFDHKVLFGNGIKKSDLSFEKQGNNLSVTIQGNPTQGMRINNFYASSTWYRSFVDKFEFANGDILSKSDIKIGTANNDTLVGNTRDNIITGNEGDDVISGGQGDDVLAGGAGSDIYNYSTGDGNDTINLAGDGSTDTLKLNDISKDDILFSRSDNDLEINFHDQLSSLIVDDYFESQFNNDSLIIDTNDEFQMQLAANANKMAEILVANTSIDEDIDGGSVDGSNQVTTQVDSSQLAELWVPKNNESA